MSKRATRFHATPWQGSFAITGGGSSFLNELLTTAGASHTVLSATIPYAPAALASLLGGAPDRACSDATARALAMAAFQQALVQHPADTTRDHLFGFGCTASLATNRAKRGTLRAHVTVQTVDTTLRFEQSYVPGGSRARHERQVRELCWRALSETTLTRLPHEALPARAAASQAQPGWSALVLGETYAVATGDHDGHALLPGAFNPLHEGHRNMRAHAERLLNQPVAYELSISNVDKPILDYATIDARLNQFDAPVWLTRLPTFREKAHRFPNATFVIGADTLKRIVDPRYYRGTDGLKHAIEELEALGIRFLVFGRLSDRGFVTLEDLVLPAPLRALCRSVPESEFRSDVSSTAMRRGV